MDRDTEAAVVAVKGDALDDAGDFLGRGSALWDRWIHVRGDLSFHGSRGDVADHEGNPARILATGRGKGWLGRIRGAGSLLGQLDGASQGRLAAAAPDS